MYNMEYDYDVYYRYLKKYNRALKNASKAVKTDEEKLGFKMLKRFIWIALEFTDDLEKEYGRKIEEEELMREISLLRKSGNYEMARTVLEGSTFLGAYEMKKAFGKDVSEDEIYSTVMYEDLVVKS